MKEVLLTGGAGYIGSNVTALLVQAGFRVVLVDDLSTGNRALLHPDAIFYEGSLLDKAFLNDVFKKHSFEAVFHLAAFSVVVESERERAKYERNNVDAGVVLLDTMLAHGSKKLIFSSSASVYGVPQTLPITEEHPLNPVSVYGQTKARFETLLNQYRKFGLRFISFRYFNATGSSEDHRFGELHEPETHLIRSIFKQVRAGKPVCVYGTDYDTPDGTCIRDYLHVVDIARAHLLGLHYLEDPSAPSEFINLGTERGTSVLEIIEHCAKVVGAPITIQKEAPRVGDVPRLLASCEKARRLLGWKPEKSLQEMIESAWIFERQRGF